MKFQYKTQNTCAQYISFDLEGNIVRDIEFYGGCNGNLKAISKLLEGATVEHIVNTLSGNTCGGRPTSCADQLSKAVQAAFEESKK